MCHILARSVRKRGILSYLGSPVTFPGIWGTLPG